MKKNQKIAQFIMICFDELCLNYNEYFSYIGTDGERHKIPLCVDGKLDKEAVKVASRILGISEKDLMTCNYDAVAKWIDKYKYFSYYRLFERAYDRTIYSNRYDEIKLQEAIFGVKLPKPVRYDLRQVQQRLIEKLKELDASLPGTYHEGAEIKDLKIGLCNFCHFPKMTEFIESYLEMIERAGELFFKALNEDLCEEEINEYNVIVSAIGIKDFVYPMKGNLYYDNILKCREIYKQENLPNFYDYITFSPTRSVVPWRCAEFVENKELVQRYINYHPNDKRLMRDFAMQTLQFKCDFVWSDAKPVRLDDEDDLFGDDEYEEIFGEPIPAQKAALERTVVYVPKTPEELGDNEKYANALAELCGSEKMGGIVLPPYRNKVEGDVKRIMSRIPLMVGTDYITWYKDVHKVELVFDDEVGGGSDE